MIAGTVGGGSAKSLQSCSHLSFALPGSSTKGNLASSLRALPKIHSDFPTSFANGPRDPETHPTDYLFRDINTRAGTNLNLCYNCRRSK